MGGKQNYAKAAIFMLLTLLGFKAMQLIIYCGFLTLRGTIFCTYIGTWIACLVFRKHYKKFYLLHFSLICLLSLLLNIVVIGFSESYTLMMIGDGTLSLGESIKQVYYALFEHNRVSDIFNKELLITDVSRDFKLALIYTVFGLFLAIISAISDIIKMRKEARAKKDAELQSIIESTSTVTQPAIFKEISNTKYETIIKELSHTIKDYKLSNEKAQFKQALSEFYRNNIDTLTSVEKQKLTQYAFEYGKDNAYNPDISKACSLIVKYTQ